MEPINCSYCEKKITSEQDFILGTHVINTATPYHLQCFDKAKKIQGFFKRPIMKISPDKFNFFI